MNCLKAEEHFSEYLEDALDYQTITAFEAHLENCEPCRCELALFQKSVDLLHHLPKINPSPHFEAEVRARIKNIEVEKTPIWGRILDAIRFQPAWAFGGAAVAILILVASLMLSQGVFFNSSPQNPQITEVGQPADITPRIPLPPPRLVAQPNTQIRPVEAQEEGLNLRKFFVIPELESMPTQEGFQQGQMEQNYILQTISYSDMPTSGGL
jgi:hypothetical protein